MAVDAFGTLDGDNYVLTQQIAKDALGRLRDETGGLLAQISFAIRSQWEFMSGANSYTAARTDAAHVRDLDFHAAALRYRTNRLTVTLAKRLQGKLASADPGASKGEQFLEAWNACLPHANTLAWAYIDQVLADAFATGVAACAHDGNRALLEKLRALHALTRLNASAFWVEAGYVTVGKAKAMRREAEALLGEIRPHVETLVDAFAAPKSFLETTIAGDWLAHNVMV